MKYLSIIEEIIEDNGVKGYLVGGAVRDYILGRDIEDIDIALEEKVEEVAKEFADRLEGSFFNLDESRDIYRVVIGTLIYDFTLIIGTCIEGDLAERDFTINSMALELKDFKDLDIDRVIDPQGGISDLDLKLIRATNKEVFKEDPLRLFRAIRFKALLDFDIDKETQELMESFDEGIAGVARERIKVELVKILELDGADQNLAYLEEKLGLLSDLVPGIDRFKDMGQCKYHREDLWTHSIYGVKKVEELLREQFWQEEISKERVPLIKLGVLLHDIGKLLTEKEIGGETHFYGHDKEGANLLGPILKRLRFSKDEKSYIKKLVRYHMRPLALYYAQNLTDKGRYRFFEAGGESVSDICLVAAADAASSRELNDREEELPAATEFLKDLIRRDKEVKEKVENSLLTGRDIIDLFGIKEGPTIGKLLKKLRQEQALGKIDNRQGAIDSLSSFLSD